MAKCKFMNISINNITMVQAVEAIDKLIAQRKKAYVVTPNVDHIIKVEKDSLFKEIYDNADLVLTDGQPLIWISKVYKRPIVEKVSGSDLFPKVCEMAAKKGYSVYFLGAKEGVADIAATKLRQQYPNINIVGTDSPPFGFEKNTKEIERVIEKVNNAHPDILALALGTPKQEKFYYQNREALDVGCALAVGASIDFAAGTVKRAPKWMSNHGLEWFYRLLKEPKRMFKRYIVDDLKIIRLIWKYRKNNADI